MQLQNCQYSFEQLATSRFPTKMDELQRRIDTPFQTEPFHTKGEGLKKLVEIYGDEGEDFPGCYVFIENTKPIYVGNSMTALARIRNHLTATNRSVSSFTNKIADEIAKAESVPEDQTLAKARERLRKCKLAWVKIENPLELVLFEIFAYMKLGTAQYNSFSPSRRTKLPDAVIDAA